MKTALATLGLGLWASCAWADMANINGHNIFYETIGDGPPVMIMHGGLGLDHTYLRPYFDQLAETHTVIYYDHYGNGRSDYPEDFTTLSMAGLVADADALRAYLGHDEMILIGHSYGGFIAQEYAAAHGDTLAGLVLVDTVPAFDYAPQVSGTDEQMAAFGALFSGPQPDNDTWQANWNLVIQMYFAEPDAELLATIDANTTYSHNAWNMGGAFLATFNMLEALPEFDMPVLSMAGALDPITVPGPGAERIAELVPGAELVILDGAAHYPFIETEAAFFAALNGWMAGLDQ